MTFQPPPPPPGDNPPPPPPPGQWGPPSGGGASFDPKNVNPLDWALLGIGLLTFIFSFISYFTASYAGYSTSTSAWHGFFGWFATLVALAAAVVVGISLFAPQVKLPWPTYLISLGLFALATLCTIIALFTNPYPDANIPGYDTGHGFGYWASLILVIAGTVISLMRVQQTGTQLPGALGNLPDIGGKGPQGGIGGGHNAPPAG